MSDSYRHLKIRELDSHILQLTMDMANSRANILNDEMFNELDRAMAEVAGLQNVKGLILDSAKPNIFVAGADLKAIAATLDWPDEKIIRFCERGRAVMARFSRCPFVTVAAIDGAAVGGGLELALWCDRRIASHHARTKLGLPEVKLGLVPGWAGTVRLPRLAGFKTAAELITSGRLLAAAEALEAGFVDQVAPAENLVELASELILAESESRDFVDDRSSIMGPIADSENIQQCVEQIATEVLACQDIYPFAPTVALEHLARTAPMEQPEAWKSESRAMAQVYGSPANRGLLNHHFLIEHNRKQPGLVDLSIETDPLKTIGIVGAGVMGRSIAEICLENQLNVLILDAQVGLSRKVVDDLNNQFSPTTCRAAESFDDLADVDLVIESVVENANIKQDVLSQIEAAVSDTTLIATNTSAIPVEKLTGKLQRPERFCGIHFCHPELMSLVEVVCGPQTSESTLTSATNFTRRQGKIAVAMNDGPGFVVNRLLAAMLDQSFRILTRGVPLPLIDSALREFGFAGGPFEIIDVIGADTCLYAGRAMWESGLRCVTLSPILPRMVKLGRLGRKSGVGFYRYPDPRGKAIKDDETDQVIDSYLNEDPIEISPEEIVTQVLSVMALEATHLMDESIVADFRDIELCSIEGFGFPRHCGGILFWADAVGLETVNDCLAQLSEQEPRLKPGKLLKEMEREKRRFY